MDSVEMIRRAGRVDALDSLRRMETETRALTRPARRGSLPHDLDHAAFNDESPPVAVCLVDASRAGDATSVGAESPHQTLAVTPARRGEQFLAVERDGLNFTGVGDANRLGAVGQVPHAGAAVAAAGEERLAVEGQRV